LDKGAKEEFRSWAHEFGIEVSAYQLYLLGIFLDELWEWNKRVNLTGLSSQQRIIEELLLDSLIPSSFLPEEGRLLDAGSGAGFPGIPLKIHKPQIEVHLMEANSKKVSFMKQVIRLTKLPEIKVIRGRIEKDRNLLHPEGYHVITARALAHLPQTVEWCAPHLLSGGLMVSFQGDQFKNAIKESSRMMRAQRLFLHKSIPYTLPAKGTRRHILIFIKH
jgi:16S rRNA (guanine527-N7)-methyltransferase